MEVTRPQAEICCLAEANGEHLAATDSRTVLKDP
jgi:hypothetical protein